MNTALASLLSLAGLFYLLLGPYNAYRIDRLRFDLFRIRDDLFLQAAADKISFNSAAYQFTRTTLNGAIRYAHRVSLVRLLLGVAFVARDEDSARDVWLDSMMSGASVSDRELCKKYIARANQRCAYHLMTSPAMTVMVIPLLAMALGQLGVHLSREIVQRLPRRFDALDRAFYGSGKSIAT